MKRDASYWELDKVEDFLFGGDTAVDWANELKPIARVVSKAAWRKWGGLQFREHCQTESGLSEVIKLDELIINRV
uniref:Thioredoxin reductase n=1 Tax=Bacillus amyloliquefaciens TaxID=1390 RepID=A0A5P6A6G3_BACAM|nr:Thioredoxin reductase [Bacillus amyloliquefaciens]